MKLTEKQLQSIIKESVKTVLKEWNGWHRTLSTSQAISLLHDAWDHYSKGEASYLTTDDVAYVDSLIDTIEPEE